MLWLKLLLETWDWFLVQYSTSQTQEAPKNSFLLRANSTRSQTLGAVKSARKATKRKYLRLKPDNFTLVIICFCKRDVPSWPLVLTEKRRATHQQLEFAKGDGGAVEEVGRQPSLVLVTVADRRPCVQKRDSEPRWWLQVLHVALYQRLVTFTTQRAIWTRFPQERTHWEPQNDLGHSELNTNWKMFFCLVFILGNNKHIEMTFTGRQGATCRLFIRVTDTWGCGDFSDFCRDCR